MPAVDVAVIGAGLAGLATALRLAEAGARVTVLAQGNGAIQWAGGPVDVGVVPGARTAGEAITALSGTSGHPYATLGQDVAAAVDWFGQVAAAGGLPHDGSLEGPFGVLPTGIGGTRPVAIVPAAQRAALDPWRPGERLVVVGPAGFKDFWPHAIAASLARPAVWGPFGAPASVEGIAVEWPGLAARRNLNGPRIAELFDDPDWRAEALEAIGRAVDGTGRRGGPIRIGLPAVLGLRDHAAALRAASERLPGPVVELPLVPPGIPGLRLYGVLRDALRALGGRILLGEPVATVETSGSRVTAVRTTAATRTVATRVGALVLATGGLAGGGLAGEPDGIIRETVLDLPVEGPPIERWMTGDPLDPGAMPIATAGLRVDDELRPVDPRQPGGPALYENVRVVGALLAGQRQLVERCGDGVALASAWRAARSLGGASAPRALEAGGSGGAVPASGGVR